MQDNFYRYQQRRLTLLLGWGLLSVIAGLGVQFVTKPFWKQFALQALAWGAIDAALAIFGLRSANRKEKRYKQGILGPADERKEARGFHRILLINVVLDVGYMLGGIWVMQRFKARSDRQGMGASITLQGLWLFLFDSLLAREVARRWK